MGKARSPKGNCAYCQEPAETLDHVPPQSLLIGVPKALRPSVPSCLACNQGASDDDEYFRDVVLKYHRVAGRPEAQDAIVRMVRAFGKPAKAKYAEATLRSFTDLRARTPSGIDLGLQPAYKVDGARLSRVAARYVRGLHFLEYGCRVEADHRVKMQVNAESILMTQEEMARVFASGTVRLVKERVFWYKWVRPGDRLTASAWLLVFFDAFPVLGFVHPPNEAAPDVAV